MYYYVLTCSFTFQPPASLPMFQVTLLVLVGSGERSNELMNDLILLMGICNKKKKSLTWKRESCRHHNTKAQISADIIELCRPAEAVVWGPFPQDLLHQQKGFGKLYWHTCNRDDDVRVLRQVQPLSFHMFSKARINQLNSSSRFKSG